MPDGKDRQSVRFGAFEFDPRAAELRKSGVKLKLRDQPCRVLEVLLENAGETVSRDDLKQRLWPEDTFVDFDNSLNTAVNKLRDVLNDSASSPRFVETVPRRGYRFLAPVERLGGPAEDSPEDSANTENASALNGLLLRAPWVAVGVVSLLLVLAVVALLEPGPSSNTVQSAVPLRRFSYQPEEVAHSPAISPDGQRIAYTTGVGQEAQLWVQDLDQELPRIVQGAQGAQTPFWSADSEFIAFFTEDDLRKIPHAGGTSQIVCRLPTKTEALGGDWSRDGESIVFAQFPHLYEVPSRGGTARLLLEVKEESKVDHVEQPHWLPIVDGRKALLYTFREKAGKGHAIAVQSLETGERRVLSRNSGFLPSYSPSGHILYSGISGERIFIEALPFSAEHLEPLGDPFMVAAEGLTVSVADDGTLVYRDTTTAPDQLVWYDRNGDRIDEVTLPVRFVSSFSASLDSTIVTLNEYAGHMTIFDRGRELATRLPTDLPVVRSIMAPNGEQVAFAGRREGSYGIYIQPLSGDLGEGPVVSTAFNEFPQSWSLDERILLYQVEHPETGGDIWYLKRNEDGTYESIPFLQTPSDEKLAVLSRDARFIAYSSDESGTLEVYVQNFPQGGGKVLVSHHGGNYPRWNSAGNELFFVSDETLVVARFDNAPSLSILSVEPLFNILSKAGWIGPYHVSDDGQRFLLHQSRGEAPPPSIRVVQNWFAEFDNRKDEGM